MIQRIGLAILSVIFVTGCFGRIRNAGDGRKIDAKAYGLDATKPALLVFSAVWCKPCMSEIPSLNRAQREMQGRLQIASFLVEGAQKGVPAAPKDADLVVSPVGAEKPAYKLSTDPSWSLFDAIQPESGRALPTMVFVDAGQTIVRIVQRSMEYDSELLPALQALVSGQKPTGPKPADPVGRNETVSMTDWIAQPGHDAAGTMYANVRAAWERGLTDFTFLADDMPFDDGKMTSLVFEDGTSKPFKAVWFASMTGCKLTVFFLADGSYERSEGICR